MLCPSLSGGIRVGGIGFGETVTHLLHGILDICKKSFQQIVGVHAGRRSAFYGYSVRFCGMHDNPVRFRTTSGREGKVSYETVPGIQGDVAAEMFEKLTTIITAQHLSFGGGTVLAARWNHRKSLDVDLFCEPTTYGRLSPRERARVERVIHEIAGCASSQTWCEDIATYTEIRGVEATVLPGIIVIEPGKPTTLDGTGLALQSSAQILYGKIAWRMYEGGEIAVRDAYDLACARKHDPQALAQARSHVSPRVLATVSEIIRQLPQGWSAEPEKALIEPRYAWSEAELQERALAALRTRSG